MANLSLQILNFRLTWFFLQQQQNNSVLKSSVCVQLLQLPVSGKSLPDKSETAPVSSKWKKSIFQFLYLAASTPRQARSKNTHREIASSLAESRHSQTLRHVLVQRILRLVTRVPFTLASILTEVGRGGREKSTALRYTNVTQAYLILRQRREGWNQRIKRKWLCAA